MARDTSASENSRHDSKGRKRKPWLDRPVDDPVMVYTRNGIVPRIPMDPDMAAPVMATLDASGTGVRRLSNGLTRKADAMCRLTARGMPASAAYLAVYGQHGSPATQSARAQRIVSTSKYGDCERSYRIRIESAARQQALPMRDYVLTRLTLESQTAEKASERIKALDLLGKSEGMWTMVHRTEKAMSSKDAQALKEQLNQRLMAALERIRPGSVPGRGTAGGPLDAPGQTPPIHSPPFIEQGPAISDDTIPPTPSLISQAHIESTPHDGTQVIDTAGVFIKSGREMTEDDL